MVDAKIVISSPFKSDGNFFSDRKPALSLVQALKYDIVAPVSCMLVVNVMYSIVTDLNGSSSI